MSEENMNGAENAMSEELSLDLRIIDNPYDALESTDLGSLLENDLFTGMTAKYLREIYDALVEEFDEEIAWNWVCRLKQFGSDEAGEFDLDEIGYSEDGDSDLDAAAGGHRDPVRMVTLVQNNTKRGKHIPTGVYFDKLLDEVIIETQGTNEDGEEISVQVEGAVLAYNQSRTMFTEASKRPECWSKDGTVNRYGGLCKECPHHKTTTCTNQIALLWVSPDFTHLVKIPFSKTGLNVARSAIKRYRVNKSPFSHVTKITTSLTENDRGSWYSPVIAVTKRENSEALQKAFRVLAELYKAYFVGVKRNLNERHDEYKAKKQGGNALGAGAGGGVPGGNALPAGPGMNPVGVGDAFTSTGSATPPPATEQHVDIDSITGGKSQ